MSNSPVKVIFLDGHVLYTIGDSTTLQTFRLYASRDAAWEAYCSDDFYTSIASSHEEAESLLKKLDEAAEEVHLQTAYGAPGWKDMDTQFARANRSALLITVTPRYYKDGHPLDGF